MKTTILIELNLNVDDMRTSLTFTAVGVGVIDLLKAVLTVTTGEGQTARVARRQVCAARVLTRLVLTRVALVAAVSTCVINMSS